MLQATLVRAAAEPQPLLHNTWSAVISAGDFNAARLAIFRACDLDSGVAAATAAIDLFARLEAKAIQSGR